MKTEKKDVSWKSMVLTISFIISFCVAATLIVVTIEDKKKIVSLNSQLQSSETSRQEIFLSKSKTEEKFLNTKKKLNHTVNELNQIRTRIEGIKTQDDLLKRDIFMYIDRKFQLIPRTVSQEIANQILKVSKEESISPELIVGIIQVESAFNPMAISKKNARGLMQLMPEWAKKFNLKRVSDFHDIDTNIKYGVKVLKIHINDDGKGNISKGLYYYVGKSSTYASKVYESMGKFVAFRSTLDSDDGDIDINGEEDEKTDNSNSRATEDN